MVLLTPSNLSVGRKFVNPHDIVLFPLWIQRMPSDLDDIEVPDVPLSPSDFEDSVTNRQHRSIALLPSCYGPYGLLLRSIKRTFRTTEISYRLHEAVDQPVDLVRAAITDNAATDTVIVRTSTMANFLGPTVDFTRNGSSCMTSQHECHFPRPGLGLCRTSNDRFRHPLRRPRSNTVISCRD